MTSFEPPLSVLTHVPPAAPARTEPGWRELVQVFSLAFGSSLFFGCMGGLLVGIYARASGAPKLDGVAIAATPFMAIATLLDGAVVVVIVREIGCRRFGRTLRAGVAFIRPARVWLISAPLIGIALFAGLFLLPGDGEGNAPIERLVRTPGGIALVMTLAICLPPVEEIYYRGFLQPIFRRAWGPIASIAVVTLWFGALHAPQLFGAWWNLAWVVFAGFVFTVQRELSGSLVPSFITHWTYNGLIVLYMAVVLLLYGF